MVPTVTGVALGFMAGLVVVARGADDNLPVFQALDRFGHALAIVKAEYVDTTDDKLLIEYALNGMISNLDPHSSYFSTQVFSEMEVKTQGQYGGVGLVIEAAGGAIKVVSPIDDTPAAKAGIKSGDVLLAVNGKGLQGASLDQVQLLLRGTPGTGLTLTLMRSSDAKSFEVHVVRAAIEVEAVKSHREGDVGYIRIPAFNEHTDAGVKAAVAALKKQIGPKLRGYVIDLRDDGGGLLDAAIGVSDDFLDSGEIVSTRGRLPADTQRFDAKPGDVADGKPIVVLINRGTASASEIVSGALKDHRRAKIVGLTSFGKGSVQSIIPMNNGLDGALHLTTARYYTPSGNSIQATGIIPDIAVANADDADAQTALADFTEANLPHHLGAESIEKPATATQAPIRPPAVSKIADFQLSYAVDLLDGKPVPHN
jgi:carboxyl-terminal processing protease